MTVNSLETYKDNPFGNSITISDILDTVEFLDDWEERYSYIIDLGKSLPTFNNLDKTEQNLVHGCQSQVWIDGVAIDGKLWFQVDSDAFIVKGLLGVVLAAYNGKSPADILAFDIEAYLDEIGLIKHLSPTRGNGLRSMVQKIKTLANS